jgi:hypothetical protein
MYADSSLNHWTSVAAGISEADARAYFVGEWFNRGVYPEELMVQVVDIEYEPASQNAEG